MHLILAIHQCNLLNNKVSNQWKKINNKCFNQNRSAVNDSWRQKTVFQCPTAEKKFSIPLRGSPHSSEPLQTHPTENKILSKASTFSSKTNFTHNHFLVPSTQNYWPFLIQATSTPCTSSRLLPDVNPFSDLTMMFPIWWCSNDILTRLVFYRWKIWRYTSIKIILRKVPIGSHEPMRTFRNILKLKLLPTYSIRVNMKNLWCTCNKKLFSFNMQLFSSTLSKTEYLSKSISPTEEKYSLERSQALKIAQIW